MKILMVGARHRAMMEDVRAGLAPSSIEKIETSGNRVLLKDGSEIHVVMVRNMMDLERVRGVRYDFVVTHESFPRDIELYHALRAYVVR